MATLTVTPVTRAGVDLAAALVAATVSGDEFPNTGAEFLVFQNTSGSPITVTLVIKTAPDGLAVTNKTISVAATTGLQIVGPFPVGNYNDTTSSRAGVTYSGVTNLKVAALKCPAAA